jgi:hypothetical protein
MHDNEKMREHEKLGEPQDKSADVCSRFCLPEDQAQTPGIMFAHFGHLPAGVTFI